MALMTTAQAAERIGVTVRHVQRLVAAGDLVAVGPDRIDPASVGQWLAERRGGRVRAWEEPTAWAAVALLEGAPVPWLGQAQRSRLKSALVEISALELSSRARNRAVVRRYAAHPGAHRRLARDVVESGATGGIGGLTASPDRLDGYVDESEVARLVQRYRLEADPAGSLTLRATTMPRDVVADLAHGRRHVLAGLDLAGSTDARERAAGHRLLERARKDFRG